MNIAEILQAVEHREWPLPTRPWVMTQIWHELLFAHWPLAPQTVRPLIPAALELDTFDGEAWIGIVPFHMSDVHPRYLPSAYGLSQFPELNVRTYVKRRDEIPGVYFFSLDAGNPLAVAIARSVFHLPYYTATMLSKRVGDTIYYRSQRTHRGAPPADYVAHYRPLAPISYASPGSLEHWLTERYSLYTTVQNKVYRGEIHHARWPLQVAELETTIDTMALAHHIHLPDTQPLLHYSNRQEVLIWPLHRLA